MIDVLSSIRALLAQRHWTVYRLAKEADMPYSTIYNLFARNITPTLPTLETICRGFGLSLWQFLADENRLTEITEEQRLFLSQWNIMSDKQQDALLYLMDAMLLTDVCEEKDC